MDKRKSHQMISVDSETGVYWVGERALKTQAQINAVIKPALKDRSKKNDRADRVQTLNELAVIRVFHTVAKYFEVISLRFM
jgi:hypothetical protein